MTEAYARAGVDTSEAGRALRGLVEVLNAIDTGKPSRSRLPSATTPACSRSPQSRRRAVDRRGRLIVVAEQTGRFDTVGIDCVAMNVNDLVCVGAEPIALLDYLAVERAEPDMRGIAEGLKKGAEQAGVEIPGGELAQLPELLRGHPSPRGFDLKARASEPSPRAMVTGFVRRHLIGVPSSGVHSNGLTLACRACSAATTSPSARPSSVAPRSPTCCSSRP